MVDNDELPPTEDFPELVRVFLELALGTELALWSTTGSFFIGREGVRFNDEDLLINVRFSLSLDTSGLRWTLTESLRLGIASFFLGTGVSIGITLFFLFLKLLDSTSFLMGGGGLT